MVSLNPKIVRFSIPFSKFSTLGYKVTSAFTPKLNNREKLKNRIVFKRLIAIYFIMVEFRPSMKVIGKFGESLLLTTCNYILELKMHHKDF
jgi:hypothetical protein